jgi:micrococcal nuclease
LRLDPLLDKEDCVIDAAALYHYGADLVRVVDGDTVHLDIDAGFYMHRADQSYRLLRINAPELRYPEGKVSRQALGDYLAGKTLIVRTYKSDNFGRYLTELWADGVNVNDWMVINGNAAYKEYA